MDNLTHSLIGWVAGETLARSTRPAMGGLSAEARRNVFVAIGVIGGNLPDLDLLQTTPPFGSGDKLSYLLDHRGYTHTILGCVVLAFLLYAGIEVWARIRRVTLAREDRQALGGMAMLAVGLHLAMDALNSYGVHPFWPFFNQWMYGDAVFIIEPLLWVAVAPLLFKARTIYARIVVGIALVAAIVAGVFVHQQRPVWYLGITLIVAALVFVGRRSSHRAAVWISAASMAGVLLIFVMAKGAAVHRVDALAQASFPNDKTIDRALTPLPTNPLCWDVLMVQTNDDRYTARHGLVSIAPNVIAASSCASFINSPDTTAPLKPVSSTPSNDVHWLGEFAMSRATLRTWVSQDCAAAALMHFARVPFYADVDDKWIMGDLRYDREKGLGFAEFELGKHVKARCELRAPWTPPREDLLATG